MYFMIRLREIRGTYDNHKNNHIMQKSLPNETDHAIIIFVD